MDDSIVLFPNTINGPRIYRGIEVDILVSATVVALIAYVVGTFTLGGLHAIACVVFGVIFWIVIYVNVKPKMNRGFIKHWFWSRGQISFKVKSKAKRDNLPEDFLPSGYQLEFRD